MWAFATALHAAPTLFDAVAAEAPQRMFEGEFNPQNLANTAWAYVAAGQAVPALLDSIAAKSVSRLEEFTPQNLTNLAWAFATDSRPADDFGLFGER